MRVLARRLLRILKLGALVGLVIGAIRALRGRPDPEVTGQASWPPLVDEAPPAARTGPVTFATTGSTSATEGASDDPDTSRGAWVDPVDGVCPASHPVKGNLQSGIFHVPGGLSYDRTIPERCYASEEAAEADGFRRAKR